MHVRIKEIATTFSTAAFTTALLLLLSASAASAATITVDDSGGADYMSIQAAVDNASAGDTIIVYSNIYYENVNISKQLTLLGVDIGSGKPVIDAQEQGNAITLSKDGITLYGFTAINASSGSGIKINYNNSIIRGNTVANNHLGIYIRYSSNVNISDNMVINNGWGIYLHQSSNNFIKSNSAYLNDYHGIGLHSSSDNNTIENNIANNNFYEGICLGESKNNTIVNNTANDNVQDGILLFSSDYNKIMQNMAVNNVYFSIDLQNSKNNIIFLNNLNNGNSYNSTNVFNSIYPMIYQYNNSTFTNYIGNYWSDYASNDEDDDGIGETPYNLSSPEGQDNYPLIEPWKACSSYDTTPPANINNFSYFVGPTWINWTWNNPSDVDFNRVMVYVNGIFWTDVISPIDYYNATGLTPNTQYCISVFTVDISGNINQTWVNNTARTARYITITISNRSILLNNQSFTLRSVGYSPVPIGIEPETTPPYGDYFTSNYDYIYNRDLPLLRQMGANTIRLWGWNNSADHTDFLNKAYNNGTEPIYVIVTFWMGHSVYQDISSPEVRARAKTNFRNMVSSHKNHPAVLMWAIGNELNAPWMYGNNLADMFSLVNEMAQEAHIEEGENYHPVTLPLADVDLINTIAYYNNNSTLDVWSIQTYRGSSFGSLFMDYANVSSKPLVITEYGIDAYDNRNGTEYELIGTPYQAVYASSLWNEIMSNSNISSGGSIMAYSDEWWKGKHAPSPNPNAGCPESDPNFHSNCGYPILSHPDGYSNEEWWGIMRTYDNGSYPDIMEPRAAYYALQSLWTNDISPPASIINLTNITRTRTYINWTWINPSDPDFNHTEVYLNGTFIINILAPQNYYNATGLLPDASYELSTRTVDYSGNINQTWVNGTATTKASGDFSGDGTTDSWDITYLARSIAGIPGYETLYSDDISGDGVVDIWDCTYLARAIAWVPGYSV